MALILPLVHLDLPLVHQALQGRFPLGHTSYAETVKDCRPYHHPCLPYAPLDHPLVLPCPCRLVLQDPLVPLVPLVACGPHDQEAYFRGVAFPCDDAYCLGPLLRHPMKVACEDCADDCRDDYRDDVVGGDSCRSLNSVAFPYHPDPYQLGSFLLNYCHLDHQCQQDSFVVAVEDLLAPLVRYLQSQDHYLGLAYVEHEETAEEAEKHGIAVADAVDEVEEAETGRQEIDSVVVDLSPSKAMG